MPGALKRSTHVLHSPLYSTTELSTVQDVCAQNREVRLGLQFVAANENTFYEFGAPNRKNAQTYTQNYEYIQVSGAVRRSDVENEERKTAQ